VIPTGIVNGQWLMANDGQASMDPKPLRRLSLDSLLISTIVDASWPIVTTRKSSRVTLEPGPPVVATDRSHLE